jgi:hypothetical protein
MIQPTTEECIALAQALEQRRALGIVEAVAALPVGGKDADAPTPFQSGYQLACEEILHRLRTEVWDGCLPPVGHSARAAPRSNCAPGGQPSEMSKCK